MKPCLGNSHRVQGKRQLEARAAERCQRKKETGGRFFEDPQLNVLEEKVNVSNQTLRAAVDRFQEARDVLRQTRSSLYPLSPLE